MRRERVYLGFNCKANFCSIMTIIRRRLSRPELLFLLVGVWLCLALDPLSAARAPSDRFVFPSESQPTLESRLKEIDREMEVVSRLTNVTLLMMPQETKQGMPRTASRGEMPPVTAHGNLTEPTKNPLKPEGNLAEKEPNSSSESKIITFGSDPESNSPRPWEQAEVPLTAKPKVVLEPRITLETTRICPEGFTLSATHCRKNA